MAWRLARPNRCARPDAVAAASQQLRSLLPRRLPSRQVSANPAAFPAATRAPREVPRACHEGGPVQHRAMRWFGMTKVIRLGAESGHRGATLVVTLGDARRLPGATPERPQARRRCELDMRSARLHRQTASARLSRSEMLRLGKSAIGCQAGKTRCARARASRDVSPSACAVSAQELFGQPGSRPSRLQRRFGQAGWAHLRDAQEGSRLPSERTGGYAYGRGF